MEARATNLVRFMQGTRQFTIPIFQRTYSWTSEQCLQLWDDVRKAALDDRVEAHFIGSIVYIENGIYHVSDVPRLLVIDGQQRLTTLTLLLTALGRAITEGAAGDLTRKKLENYYLFNAEETGELRYKLVLTRNDKETLTRLLDDNDPPTPGSARILENYQFFVEKIRRSNIAPAVLYAGIIKLMLVDISLDRDHDDPQLIFESLNSTGLELSQADLIRNYVLMGLEFAEQSTIYTSHWLPMEQRFGGSPEARIFDRFMRDYLTVKSGAGAIPNIGDVYSSFKAYREAPERRQLPTHDIVADVYRYAQHFGKLTFADTGDREVDRILGDINALKVDVAYPLFLELFDDYARELLSRDDLIAILRIVESYIVRRAMCDIPTNSLNKTFATLGKEVDRTRYRESVEATLLLRDSYRRFPSDDEFREHFIGRNVYDLTKRRMYLLTKLENYHHREPIATTDYTVEHIMPQNEHLSPEWRSMLGPDWKQVQSKYLHTIGNLTLTAYNPELSDRPFDTKRDMQGGFRDSHLRLNADLADTDSWNQQHIEARAARLADVALKIWPRPALAPETLAQYAKTPSKSSVASYALSETNYAAFLQGETLALFDALRERILMLDGSVREEPKKLYIAYKDSSNFVDVEPQRSRLRLTLNMRFNEVSDPQGLCADITGLGRWGNGNVEIILSSPTQLDDVMALIGQVRKCLYFAFLADPYL